MSPLVSVFAFAKSLLPQYRDSGIIVSTSGGTSYRSGHIRRELIVRCLVAELFKWPCLEYFL